MAAPHVSGVAALLIQVRPSLTPDQIQQVVEVSARPMSDEAPFWESGYGFVDAGAAVALVRRGDFGPALLQNLLAAATARVQGARPYSVVSSDFWGFAAAPLTIAGIPSSKTFTLSVGPDTKAIRGMVSYPSTGVVGANLFDYQLTLRDAAGKVVARSLPSGTTGTSTMFADLRNIAGVTYGTWTVQVTGALGLADSDSIGVLGDSVTTELSQLAPQGPGPSPNLAPVPMVSPAPLPIPGLPALPIQTCGLLDLLGGVSLTAGTGLPAIPGTEPCAR